MFAAKCSMDTPMDNLPPSSHLIIANKPENKHTCCFGKINENSWKINNRHCNSSLIYDDLVCSLFKLARSTISRVIQNLNFIFPNFLNAAYEVKQVKMSRLVLLNAADGQFDRNRVHHVSNGVIPQLTARNRQITIRNLRSSRC